MLLVEDFLKIGFILIAVGVFAASHFKVKNSVIFMYSMMSIYIILVLGITLCPIPYGDVEHIYPAVHNFSPFKTIGSIVAMGMTLTAFTQIVGNILIAVPYGLFLGIRLNKYTRRIYILLPLLFPVIIEGLQLLVGVAVGVVYRSFDIDDFILNASGAYLGIVFGKIYLILMKKRSAHHKFRKNVSEKKRGRVK